MLFLPLVSVLACDGMEILTACNYTRVEPLVAIVEVNDLGTGVPLESVVLRDVSVDGFPERSEDLAADAGWTKGMTLSGGSLVCRPRCAFGAIEGRWIMVLARTGYEDLSLEFDARYQKMAQSGCEVSVWGPTELRPRMARVSSFTSDN